MADLAAELARDAAARALAKPEEPPAPEPAPQQAAEPIPEPATTRTRSAPAFLRVPACRAPSCKRIDPALLFTRLVATMCRCIALEARLAGGAAPAPRAAAARPRPLPAIDTSNDPRRAPLLEVLAHISERQPRPAECLRGATARLDEVLAADPKQTIARDQMFFSLCEERGIEVVLAKLRDKYLYLLMEPRATSPP